MTAVQQSVVHPPRGRTCRFAFLAISFAVHCLILLAPATPQRPHPPQRSFKVSVLHPEELPPQPAPQTPPSGSRQIARKPAALPAQIPAPALQTPRKTTRSREATVSLNAPAGDIPFASYLSHLRARIDSCWQYPARAQTAGLEGMVTLRFTLHADGTLGDVQVVETSGQEILDRESVQTVRAAAPFNRFTPDMDLARLNVLATFCYRYSGQ